MKKTNLYLCYAAIALMAILSSCSSKKSDGIEYIPYQESESGWWGMVGLDGKVLFQNQFKNRPTVAVEGLFLVKNQEGFWEYYTAEEKPEKKGVTYVSATLFEDGRALVVEPNKPVEIINTDFEVVKTIDKVDGKNVTGVYPFDGGFAVVECDSLRGVIDNDGNVVLQPVYGEIENNGDGTFCVVKIEDEKKIYEEGGNVQSTVLNSKGEKIGSYPYLYRLIEGDYGITDYAFVDSMAIAVNTGEKNNYNSAIINFEGKFVVKPSDNNSQIDALLDHMYTYYSSQEESWGVKKVSGEDVVKPQFDHILLLGKDRIACGTEDKAAENNSDEEEDDDMFEIPYQYYITDIEGNRLGSKIYSMIYRFGDFDGEHAPAQVTEHEYTIIGLDGEMLKDLPKMYDISLDRGDYMLQSDYVDLQAVVSSLKITSSGMYGVSMTSGPSTVASRIQMWSTSPQYFTSSSEMTSYRMVENVNCSFCVEFDRNLGQQSYTTQRIVDGYFYGGYYYHDVKSPNGYYWTAAKMRCIVAEFNNNGNLHGKLLNLKKLIASKLKGYGSADYDEKGATYVSMSSGYQGLVYMTNNYLYLVIGKIRPAANIGLDSYKSGKEKAYDYDVTNDQSWKYMVY